jgi:hypothetical protein
VRGVSAVSKTGERLPVVSVLISDLLECTPDRRPNIATVSCSASSEPLFCRALRRGQAKLPETREVSTMRPRPGCQGLHLPAEAKRIQTTVFSTVGGSPMAFWHGPPYAIRHGSSGALFVRLRVLGGPIGEPVAAL